MAEKDETHSRELQKMQAEQSQLEQDFNAQVSQYAELEQSLNFANHEITDYYNSTSWKITRPLRWISKKLRGSNV
jgi:outer membrane murein-binding lipoprotein Lpp